MKRLVLRFSVLVAALAMATGASAQVNLSWDDCGPAGGADKTFACNVNTGAPFAMVASCLTQDAPHFVAIEGYIDMIEANPTVLPWWEMDGVNMPTACRPGNTGHSWSADFLAGPFSCVDFWAGAATGGGGVVNNYLGLGTNTQRFKGVFAIPAEQPMTPGDEIYAFKVNILRAKTVGTGSCAGCTDPVCFVLNRVVVIQPAGFGDFNLSGAIPGGRDFVTWQGGAGAPCATVPTQNRTWGQVKALYR